AEAAAGRQTLKAREVEAPLEQIAHVHVGRREAGAVEGGGHLELTVHALLTQDRDAWPRAPRERERSGYVSIELERGAREVPGLVRVDAGALLLLGAARIVAQSLDAVGRVRPQRAQARTLPGEQRVVALHDPDLLTDDRPADHLRVASELAQEL